MGNMMLRMSALLAALAMGSSAMAQAAAATPTARWEFDIAPYVLFPTMQGTNTVGNLPTLSINAGAGEIFSHLQGGAMLYLQARKGSWAFATDVIYMKLGMDINPDGKWVAGSATYKQGAWEGFLFYRVTPKFEVGLGGLGNKIDVELNGTVPPGATPTSGSTSVSWGMPVLAARWSPINGAHWTGVLFADLGGTSGDNQTWQVMPSVGYKFGKTFELALQYRYIAIDYQTGSGVDFFQYRMNIFGPQVGFLFHL